jgi:dipeptidyl aminopeptidase/acylaminoacyl peptidase
MRHLSVLLLAFASAAFAEPPGIEALFAQPRFNQLTISPDGRTIAALAPVAGRQNLVVLDAASKKPTPVTGFNTRDVVEMAWVNSKRVLVRSGSLATREADYRGGALYAIDIDGSDGRMVSEGGDDEQSSSGARLVGRLLAIVRMLPGETDDFIAQEVVVTADGNSAGDVFRVNSRTGRRTSIGFGKPDAGQIESWVVDDKGVARVQTVHDKGMVRIHYRAGPDAAWQKLDEFPENRPAWHALAIGDDDKSLLVADQRSRDKAAIVRYDPATKSFGEVVAEHPQVDLNDLIVFRGHPYGVHYEADRGGSAYFDEGLARLQDIVDRALPKTVNRLSWSADRSRVIVAAHSDVIPGSFYLLDTKAGKMEWLVDRMPQLRPADLAPMRPIHYPARDGLQIPAYLTLPKGKDKNLPLVLIIHGGPWVPGDTWGFDPEAQFLATRGYAVLQPNFRGTTRYGWKHFSSSFGQWGLAMQDDITDGVKYLVGEGIADPKRVCIYGASYGGYATMMGLAKDPDLYKCGINYVGVTDINLFLTATWADYAQSDWIQYGVKDMVGDASKDAQRIKATSPVELAARIKAPVLMAYGAADRRVPIEHGQRMRAAMERNGAKPIWMVADGEGHGFRDMKNQKMFYEAMEKFLEEHIGK